MKFIPIAELEAAAQALGWDGIRQGHLAAMAGMNARNRKTYINNHPDWNLLQPAMMALSNNKCWYSEAPGGNNDFSVEHFRPKNRAVYSEDYKDASRAAVAYKPNGYWWKAYCYDNYRLCGTYANLRRADRLNPLEGTKGKGNYFPLDLEGVGTIATDNANLSVEIPILLDPCVEEDVSLLTFDENGQVISAGQSDYEHNRVLQSIFYYHLDLEQLTKERLIAWKDCEREIKTAKDAIDNAPDERARRLIMGISLRNIKDYIKNPARPYSAVSKACVMVYSELDGYSAWLKRFVRANLI